MKKPIAWTFLIAGIVILCITIILSIYQYISTSKMLIPFILSFVFIFLGMSNMWVSTPLKKQITTRKYFFLTFSILVILSVVTYHFKFESFVWFYVTCSFFFTFAITPINASIRIKKWNSYIDSKITLNILSYADFLGVILLSTGLTWKYMHWPLANQFQTIGIGFLVISAILWNKLFRKQIDLRIVSESKLSEKNTELLDSISYAKRIQSAIFPSSKLLKEKLNDSFILYKPKDIVAGDFYWLEPLENEVLFAVADCTGHGVPGALVSVICNSALNRSVREYNLFEPGLILDKTKELVIEEFEKSEEEVKDGMDIALCKLHGSTLFYSGANIPLLIVRNGKILETKADKQPIGKYDSNIKYKTHQFKLIKNDTIYIFSDGFVDQFGGKKEKKYKRLNLKKFILSLQNISMDKQKELLNQEFLNWKGDLEQIDDVCIIGIKV